ncbi:hypothetical protein EGP64_00210 [bacterium]|nr:hypothetical protein [bacterium]
MTRENGWTLRDNIILISLVSVVTLSLTNLFGGYIRDDITKDSCNMVDKMYVEGMKPGQAICVNK